jgi:hypothetical protein
MLYLCPHCGGWFPSGGWDDDIDDEGDDEVEDRRVPWPPEWKKVVSDPQEQERLKAGVTIVRLTARPDCYYDIAFSEGGAFRLIYIGLTDEDEDGFCTVKSYGDFATLAAAKRRARTELNRRFQFDAKYHRAVC